MDNKTEELKQRRAAVVKDERDIQLEIQGRSWASELMIAVLELMMVVCLVKGDPAWKICLGTTFIGAGGVLGYLYKKYESKYVLWVAAAFALAGAALLAWFCFAD